jgi:AraC-like DNA-binding protein
MNTSDIFKIAEIKSAAAAEAQKFADTIKSLNEICEKSGYKSLELFWAKIEEFKNDNGGVSSGKKVKRAEMITKAPKAAKIARKRAKITQEIVNQMKAESATGLTANAIAEKLGVSTASFNVYKAKDFVFNPKPKGRKKKE